MMTEFFAIGHNSFNTRGFAWIDRIVAGCKQLRDCTECEAGRFQIPGDIQVTLEANKGRQWPDVLGCGAHPLFIVSEQVIKAWQAEDIVNASVGGQVILIPPFPKRLEETAPPTYYWLDGEAMLGAQMDFDASGFVKTHVCSTCKRHVYDVNATYDLQSTNRYPYAFIKDSWNGTNLFTSDLSPAVFFCTTPVIECARKHRHTNFRFTPTETGRASWSKGVDYLGKPWPVKHPLRPSEGKTLDQWVNQLRIPTERYEARIALLDLGKNASDAIPTLTSMLDDEDVALSREAALLLSALGKLGVPLGQKEEAAARKHEEQYQRTLSR